MKPLTDNICEQIRNGWRVGIEENGHIAVFEVLSRLGAQLRGDEKWIMYPKTAGKTDGPVSENPRLFFELNLTELAYCHSPSNGQEYMIEPLISQYE